MEYKIIESHGLELLQTLVNDALKQGWSPLGGVTVYRGSFYQTMIKQ